MEDWIEMGADERHIAREREKARDLRRSSWWKNQLARGVCHYCGGKFPPEELTMDHLIPVARGGRSTRGNVVPCCKKCNMEKKYLTPAELLLRELDSPAVPPDSEPES